MSTFCLIAQSALVATIFTSLCVPVSAATVPAAKPQAKTPAVKTAQVRAHAKRGSHARYRYGAYFVPPPPAYMPSILPELARRGAATTRDTEAEVAKQENPYSKYVKTPEGDAPEPLQQRKGVVTWSRRS